MESSRSALAKALLMDAGGAVGTARPGLDILEPTPSAGIRVARRMLRKPSPPQEAVDAAQAENVAADNAPGVAGDDDADEPAPASETPAEPETPEEPDDSDDPAEAAARKFIDERRQESTLWLRKVGQYSFFGYFVASAIAVMYFLPLRHLTRHVWHTADGIAAITIVGGFAVIGILSILSQGPDGGLRRAIIGRDGRFSTSLTQAALWTLALFYVLGYLFLRQQLCTSCTSEVKPFAELDSSYMFLLGGPFAAAAAARATVSSKVAAGTLQRVPGEGASPRDIVSNDDGQADLVDTQFLLFNVVALTYFFVVFLNSPTGLPDLPQGLVALTSLGALTYATNKALATNAPVITAVKRIKGDGPFRPGDRVDVLGVNLVPSGASEVEFLHLISVQFGDTTATLSPGKLDLNRDNSAAGRGTGDLSSTSLRVRIPEGLAPGVYDVTVVTAAGVTSNAVQVTVANDVPTLVSVTPTTLTRGGTANILGTFLTNRLVGGRPFVDFGGHRVRVKERVKKPGQRPDGYLEKYEVDVPAHLPGHSVHLTVVTTAGDETAPVEVPLAKKAP